VIEITYSIPVKTISEANVREHWAPKAKRAKAQRTAAWAATSNKLENCPPDDDSTLEITLTRLGPRRMDSDNLARSMKAVRDGIADALGIDDGSDRLQWHYKQASSKKRGLYSVIVSILKRGG